MSATAPAISTQQAPAPSQAAAVRLGFNGEISNAIEQKMFLSGFGIQHVKNFDFSRRIGFWHEAVGHAFLGMICSTHPHLFVGMSYQGNEAAEVYVAAIELCAIRLLNKDKDYTNDKRVFVNEVVVGSQGSFLTENLDRCLVWLVADEDKKTSFEVRRENSFETDALIVSAELAGIKIIEEDNPRTRSRCAVKIVSPKHGTFDIYGEEASTFEGEDVTPLQIKYPEKLAAVEPFVPYAIVTEKEAGAVYDALLPAFQLLQEKIQNAKNWYGEKVLSSQHENELLDQITVAEVMESLANGTIYNGPIRVSILPLPSDEAVTAPMRRGLTRRRAGLQPAA